MKTASRASWTRAATVATPETILRPREQAAGSSRKRGRAATSHATSPAAPAAMSAAASHEPVNPIPAVKPKIPAARPRDVATSARSILPRLPWIRAWVAAEFPPHHLHDLPAGREHSQRGERAAVDHGFPVHEHL